MEKSIAVLNEKESSAVFGGVLKAAVKKSWQKPLEDTYRRITMIYCLGKEIKKGIEDFSLSRIGEAGICLFGGLFIGEFTKNLANTNKKRD